MKDWLLNKSSPGVRRKLPYIICLLSSLFFAYELVQFHMMNAISPFLMKDLGLQATSFANLCACYLLADVIFLLPAGIILDHFSVRKVIIAALSCCIIGTFGFSLSQTFYEAAFFHFLSGIGNAFCLLSSLILVSRWFETEKRALIMSLVVTIGMLGAVIAQSPFSLLASLFSWRSALLIDGFIGIILLSLIILFVYDNPKKDSEAKQSYPFWKGFKMSVFNIQNLLLGLYTSLINMPLMVISAVFGSLFLTQVHNLDLTKASFVISMISFGTIFGSTLFGYLSTKTGSKRSWMLFGSVASTCIFFAIQFINEPSFIILTLLFFMLGLFTSTQVLSYPLLSENNPKELTGTSMGIAAVIIMGLPMIIQPLTGFILDLQWDKTMVNGAPLYSKDDFFTAFLIFPLLFLIAFFSTFFIKEKKTVNLRA
jgi:MFS family permease